MHCETIILSKTGQQSHKDRLCVVPPLRRVLVFTYFCTAAGVLFQTLAHFLGDTVRLEDAHDNAVADHYRKLGAILKAKVGRACRGCMRGLIASDNVQRGETLFALPIYLVHFLHGAPINGSNLGIGNLEMYTYTFAIDVFSSRLFNETHKAWFESMHRNCRDNIYRATESDLDFLEIPELKMNTVDQIQSLKVVFENMALQRASQGNADDVALEPNQITLEQFLDTGCMVQTRRMQVGSKQAMIPLFDFCNNAESLGKANANFFENDTHVGFIATRPIKVGTEIRWSYRGAAKATPDQTFLFWQYVTEDMDLLFHEDEKAFKEIFLIHSYPKSSQLQRRTELIKYIDKVLNTSSTSMLQDKALLKSESLSNIQKVFVKLRFQRKRILAHIRNLLQHP